MVVLLWRTQALGISWACRMPLPLGQRALASAHVSGVRLATSTSWLRARCNDSKSMMQASARHLVGARARGAARGRERSAAVEARLPGASRC